MEDATPLENVPPASSTPDPGDVPPHAFDRARTRGLVAWGLLGLVLGGIVAALLGRAASFDGGRGGNEILLQPPVLAFMAFVYLWLLLWFWRQDRLHGLHLNRFLRGPAPPLAPLAGLVVLILVFSFGSFWFVHQALLLLSPELAGRLLESPELLILPMTTIRDVIMNLGVFVVVVVLAPVVEELVFRGFLVNRWGRRLGLPAGILLSSTAFAVLHVHWVGLFVFGLVMCLLYSSTGSLRAPIVAHALNNGTAFALALLGAADLGVADPGTLERAGTSGWTAALMLLVSVPLLLRWVGARWPAADAPLPWDADARQAPVASTADGGSGGRTP